MISEDRAIPIFKTVLLSGNYTTTITDTQRKKISKGKTIHEILEAVDIPDHQKIKLLADYFDRLQED